MRRPLLVLLPAAVLLLGAKGMDPEQRGRNADAEVSAAKDAETHQRWHEAAGHWLAAYKLTNDPVVLVDLGKDYEEAEYFQSALGAYQRFARAKPAQRDQVQPRIDDLRTKLGQRKPVGIPECDQYLDFVWACTDKMPDGVAASTRKDALKHADDWRDQTGGSYDDATLASKCSDVATKGVTTLGEKYGCRDTDEFTNP